MNNKGESTEPCFTPLRIGIGCDRAVPICTILTEDTYQLEMTLIFGVSRYMKRSGLTSGEKLDSSTQAQYKRGMAQPEVKDSVVDCR